MEKQIKLNRRTFVKTTVLGTIGAMSVPALLESCSNNPKVKDVADGTKTGLTALGDNPINNARFTVCATFEKQGEIQIATGTGNETVSVKVNSDEQDAKDPAFSWWYKKPVSSNPDIPEYKGRVTVGGRARPAFGWTDNVLEWTDYYERIRDENSLSKRKFYITLESHEGFGRLFVNGMLMHEWPIRQNFDRSAFKVSALDGATVVGQPEVMALSSGDELFWPMDISARYNAKGIAGDVFQVESLPVHDAVFKVNNVPFIIGSSALDGNDHLDIGQSWFREGNVFGTYEEPHNGSFGGRWAGAHSNNPTRFQFRLPNRAPKAIHLLAVTDGHENAIPRLTAQFYRVASGFPVNIVSPDIPLATAKADAKKCRSVRTASGKTLNLWQVAIPVNPGLLQQLSCYDDPDRKYVRVNQLTDRDMLEVEFTKEVSIFREYPDPCHYSAHGAGLPSSVQLFAATIEYPAVEVRFDPDAYGNVWTVPAVPSYTVSLTNRANKAASVKLRLDSISHSGAEKQQKSMRINLAPFEAKNVSIPVPVKRFGHHDLTLYVTIDKEEMTLTRSLAYLRQREHEGRPFDTRGFMFGYWNWSGSHATPNADEEVLLMGQIGMESVATQSMSLTDKGRADAERLGIKRFSAASDHVPVRGLGDLKNSFFKDPDTFLKNFSEKIQKHWDMLSTIPKYADPSYVTFYGEPGGIGTYVFPEFFGEELERFDHNIFKGNEAENFKLYHDAALAVAKLLREMKPDLKLMIPWGDICFIIPFLRENDELTQLLDGAGVDFGFFDRLAEMQFHQSPLHRCYIFKTYWDKYKPGIKPFLPVVEGPCIAQVMPGALTGQKFADSTIRAALVLAGYGITRQFAMCSPVECSNMWGEQHYGGGSFTRLPELNPHICYSAMGTLIRHLRWMEFVGWKPTGSLSTYCHHYCDSRSNKDMFVLWTVRGTRQVTMTVPTGVTPELYDSMDNIVPLKLKDGTISFTIDQSPIFLYGPDRSTTITLGMADHSDAMPGNYIKSLGYMSDLLRQDTSPALVDYHYTNSFPDAIRRFPAEMKIATVTVSRDSKSGNFPALSIELPPQPKDRGIMPFFSTFVLDKPVEISGKAKYLSLWAKGASDWGRVVYVLRDAKGESWISVGSIGEWNCDDMPCESYFNFDGWRLLRFEMPSHAPYDRYREAGSVWWGSMGNGDGIVDLPLKLEKVYVERRPKAMYVNSLEPADLSPVLLGELIAEYASPDEMGEEVIRRDRILMPSPQAGFKRSNPIVGLKQTGELKPTRITKVEHTTFEPNGTRGVFYFDQVTDAVSYDIWISTEPDGTGALHLGKDIKNTEVVVSGTRPNSDLYAFIIFKDKNGKVSKPSEPFQFKLDSQFGNR